MNFIRSAIATGVALSFIVSSSQGFSAFVTFTDESTFLASSDAVVVEGFESSSGTNISSLSTPNFLITHSQSFSVLGAPSPFGTFAIDGTNFIEESLAGVANEFRFDGFAAPLTSFGLFVTDYGDFGIESLTLTIDDANAFVIASQPLADGNSLFFGVVATGGDKFSKVTLRSDDAIGIDRVSVSAVPEPSRLVLSVVVVGSIATARTRRGKRTHGTIRMHASSRCRSTC